MQEAKFFADIYICEIAAFCVVFQTLVRFFGKSQLLINIQTSYKVFFTLIVLYILIIIMDIKHASNIFTWCKYTAAGYI